MYCMKCGKKIDDDSNFCDGCGARVVQFEAEEPVEETPETVTETQPVAEPEAQPVAEPEAQPEAEPEAQPEAEPEAQPVAQPEVQPEAEPEAQPVAEPEAQPVAEPEVQPAAEPEAQTVAQPEAQTVAQPTVSANKQKVKFKDLPAKEKKKRAIIGGICFLLALVLIFGDVFGGGKNEFIIETGNDDMFGGVAFDLEFGDFIERYNDLVEAESEYESVATMKKIKYTDFFNNGVKDGIHQYIYSFGYTTGTAPFLIKHDLASISIGVNPETDKIQVVTYVWQTDNYNTDDAMQYYYFELPAKIFSLFCSEIEYNYKGDYEDYKNLINSLIDGKSDDKAYKFSGNTMYGLLDTGSEKYMGFQMGALTKDSEAYENAK